MITLQALDHLRGIQIRGDEGMVEREGGGLGLPGGGGRGGD